MPSAPAGGRFGMRGGNWLPNLAAGEKPFGVVDGVRKECPEPVKARCGCTTWTVVPASIGDPCTFCGWPLVRCLATDVACRHCRRLMSHEQHAAGWCPYCGEPVDREVQAS